MQVRVLGPTEVVGDSGAAVVLQGAKARGLVAVLALSPGATLTAARLIAALWDEPPASGANVLQVTVSKLRRSLAAAGLEGRITTRPNGYRLDVEAEAVDAVRFEGLVDRARSTSDPEQVVATLDEALALWSGPALADVPATAVTDALRARLDELRSVAIEERVDTELALGRHRRLVPELEALVAADPLRERRWGQLMRALYGAGQQTDALRAYQRARQVLVDEMGVEPGAELRRIEAAVLAHDDSLLGSPGPAAAAGSPPPPVGDGFRRRGNLRHPVGSCVGREDDLDRLTGLLGRHRLVTLVGPGGVGKTRLAQELGHAVAPDAAQGVWWVDLAAARTGEDVVAAVRSTFRLDGGGIDAAAIADALGDDSLIVVLDTCEHLHADLAGIVADLLGRCGGLRVVATSRAALGLRAEIVFTVAPLSPTAAAELFEERIAGITPAEGPQTDATIAAICDRLDHLPLALELAAARARHLSLDEIFDRLTDRFDLLRDPSAAPEERNDLRTVADWSYDLLDDRDRIVFERLSVCTAGATLGAARAVCATDAVAPTDVEDALARLVDRSLVHVVRTGPTTRFRMLQTLADYAGERLRERGTEAAAHRAHATWVRDLAVTMRHGQATSDRAIAAAHDEDVAVRDAVGWALTADPALAVEICAGLSPFWFGAMRAAVGWDLVAAAVKASDGVDAALRFPLLGWGHVFATMAQDLDLADRLADEATALAEADDDEVSRGRVLLARALAAGYGAVPEREAHLAEARRILGALGEPIALGHLDHATGAIRLLDGDLDGAADHLGAAVAVFRAAGHHLGLMIAISRLGEVAWRRGDVEAFAATHRELLELGRAARSPAVVVGATARLGLARLLQGDVAEAQALANAALEGSGETFQASVTGYTFKTAGLVNLHLGHETEARAQLGLAVDAFSRGAGDMGIGLAALCWLDLARSHGSGPDADHARAAAANAAAASRDPWVVAQVAAG